ncbi:MAG TPA: HAD hydrolase-like protein [Thermoplasmata archaeon]|nr:HAD hydrolase-like protein [Thermoplasmata archaeon]
MSRTKSELPPERSPAPTDSGEESEVEISLPMARSLAPTGSLAAPPLAAEPPASPRAVERGVVVFDVDGTLLDSISLISHVAADVLFRAFATPPDEGRIHYLATTGMPFEAQLAQLYPEAPAALRLQAARVFHQRKIAEAYAHAGPFPEVPKLLKRLAQGRWTLVVSTGAEREMAELMLEREGLRYWFEGVLGSGQGTKREHLLEYARRFPGVPIFLVGDSRFDMEAAASVNGVIPLGRASMLHGWALAPEDLKRWGARWADYTLAELPEVLEKLSRSRPRVQAGNRRTPGTPTSSPRRRTGRRSTSRGLSGKRRQR